MRSDRMTVLVLASVMILASSSARAADGPATQPAGPSLPTVIYTKANAPATPKLEDLPLKESVSHFGVTWTFEKPVRCGQFVNGDWYVVGPATVVAIDPKPLNDDPNNVRNGFMVNPPAIMQTSAYDSRLPHARWFHPELVQKLPAALKPGDAMMSSISKDKPGKSGLPIKSFSVLTCIKEPVPADAFRPGYAHREQTIYLARDLKRDRLPRLAPPTPEKKTSEKLVPEIAYCEELFSRPWNHMAILEDAEAEYQFGGYGRSICEWVANSLLLLSMDYQPQEKEPLLIDMVQHGLDLWSFCKVDGFAGWPTLGGWGSGRKLPIVFAGLMLGDEKMASPVKTYPRLRFQEDNQTHYDDCWTGAGVVYAGHVGWVTKAPQKAGLNEGPYENLHPTRWTGWMGTSYRTNMTSSTWIGEALAIRILQAETEWDGNAFMDYCDRWMYEPDPGYRNPEYFSVQGNGYDHFAEAMWKTYRQKLPEIPGCPNAARPTTGWEKKREMKGPEVAIGKGRELVVKGKPIFPIMIFGEHPGRVDDAAAIGCNVIAEGCFEKPDNVSAYSMLNVHDPALLAMPEAKSYGARFGVTWATETTNKQFLDALAAKGMYGIFGADARALGHPALLGWIHVDAPDEVCARAVAIIQAKGLSGKGRNELETFSPASFVMRQARGDGGGSVVSPELKDMPDDLLLVQPAYQWMKKMDAARPTFLTVGEAFFKAAAEGKKDLCQSYLKNCEAVGCKVPLAKVGESVAKLRELAGPNKLVYAWIETGAPQAAPSATTKSSTTKAAPAAPAATAQTIKPEEIRAAVIAAIKNGATGIGYRGFEGLRLDVKPDPAILAELKKINDGVTAHAAELLADPSKAESLLK